MYEPSASDLSGQQKAAVLLIALGPEYSAKLFKHLDDDEIEKLTLEIASQQQVTQEQKNDVISEFYQLLMAKSYISHGGLDYAQKVLEKALGSDKAATIIGRLTASLQVRPFDFLRKTDPSQLLNFIQNEHPQTIAMILAYLSPEQAAGVLSSLPADNQADIARRIAVMDRTSPEVLREVERVLEKKLSAMSSQDFTDAGGIAVVVEMLNRVDRTTERTILDNLEVENPELTEEIKRLMFVFEDIVMLDDRAIQLVLREVDSKELSLAMKGTSEEVASKIYKNMSKRAAATLKEELEYMGPVRIHDVEEAQQKVVNIIRRLEEKGEIIVSRGKGDEMIV
ncbi:flagellar motor switch protein FliG [Pectinatus brassicae]|uniref:Flagellar motor switch protein FliG n=1 Tax=Pectinatus brassicae TaxID=862415 RepID=A0A840UQZ4_9FIRM|nr:flagellar motor switch protein FliG [Pectinatus brassicae]MBB5336582.1 flagellar motor switch protein FliG [Pectinatus brassicae]